MSMMGLEPLSLEQKKSKAQFYNHSAKPFTYVIWHFTVYLNSLQGRMKSTKMT